MLTKPSKNKQKAQSAMEYLMTYGWAILIIAVVLGALFSLGVFSGAGALSNACVAASGFLCQTPIYQHTNANIVVTLGQNTGTNWVTANFVFVPQGTPVSGGLPSTLGQGVITQSGCTPGDLITGFTVAGATGNSLISGQTSSCTLATNGVTSPVTVGVAATGAIWAEYTTSSSGPLQYAQIATVNIKAS